MAETNSRKLQREKGVGPHVALNLEARASVELRALPASFPEQQRPGAAASHPWEVARGRWAGVVGSAPLRSPQTLWLESMWGAVSGLLRATGQSPPGGHPSREGMGQYLSSDRRNSRRRKRPCTQPHRCAFPVSLVLRPCISQFTQDPVTSQA